MVVLGGGYMVSRAAVEIEAVWAVPGSLVPL